MKKMFVEINDKCSSLADNIKAVSIRLDADDKSFDRFLKIVVEAGTMLDNYMKMEMYMSKEKSETLNEQQEPSKSVFDNKADERRK